MRNRTSIQLDLLLPRIAAFAIGTLLAALPGVAQPDPAYKQHAADRPKPPVVNPGGLGRAPSDAIVLFDGKDLAGWCSMDGTAPKWIVKDGVMECVQGSGMIRTLQSFGDCQLHVEWAAPIPPRGQGQGRGNSGVFLMGTYEIQVLDSYQNTTYADGQAGAVYGQYPPLVNASLPPGEWQTYDVVFRRPRFDGEGRPVSPARITLLHNGVLVQDGAAPSGPTTWMRRPPYRQHLDKLPLSLQDHGNPVRFRNIWVRELGSDAAQKEFSFSTALLDRYVGTYYYDPLMSIVILRKEEQLIMKVVSPGGEADYPLFAESETKFFTKLVDCSVTFRTNAQGVAEGLAFVMGGDTRQAKKIK